MLELCHRGFRRRSVLSGLTLLLAFLAAVKPICALDPHKTIAQYAHEVWNAKNGLPEADVMAILQTRDGYLWFASEEGLARFDGANFTIFDRRTTPLPNNRIQALMEAPDGSLWIGTESGLSRLKDRQFTNYSTREGLPNNNIRDMWSEPDGTLWVATSKGVAKFHNGSFQPDTFLQKLAGGYPHSILHAPSSDTWVAVDSGVIVASSRRGPAHPRTLLAGKRVRALLQGSDGTVWAGTMAGLYRIRDYKAELYPLGGHNSRAEVTELLEDRDHNLWVGTLGDGLIRIGKEGTAHYSSGDGLSGVEIKSLFEDAGGNLWVGVFGGGVEVFRDTMFTPYGKQEGLSQNLVWTIMQGRDSSMWIGTQSGGLNRLKDGKVTVYSTRRGFSDDTVGSMFEAHDGGIWLGKDSGLSRLVDNKVTSAPAAYSAFREQVHAIYEDGSGTVWIGTRTSGLIEFRDGKRRSIATGDGLANNNVQVIVPSKRGGMWVGTLGGLSYYKDGKFKNFTSKDGLSADQVISLYEDAEGTLWVGSVGLNRFKDGKFTRYADQEGLFDHNPLAILEDGKGYLWLSTNKGIFRVAKQQLNDFAEGRVRYLTPTVFGTDDGMRSAECNGGSAPSGWKDRDGNLWFATVAGALKIDPRRFGAASQRLQVHVEGIWADKKYIAPADSLRVPPGGGELEFHYVAPYFAGTGRVHYRYQLEGFDKGWVDARTRTVAYYTNLPPGQYRFRVEAALADGTGTTDQSAVNIYLTPQFYQTNLFYAALTIAGLGLVLLVWVWTHRFMIRRQNELKRLVTARTHELEAEKVELLEAKAALAEQATHDSLTGLMNRAAIFHVLEQQLRQSEREKTSFVVMLADLDHFKSVNDTHGHLVGDEVLREFTRRLNHNLRPYDHAGRFGGEEFLIVMPGLSEDYGERISKLHDELCHPSFVCGDLELKVTCSIGVTFYNPTIKDIESLLREADLALYVAKAKGRDRVEMAGKLAGKDHR